jgi:hypothetical protein
LRGNNLVRRLLASALVAFFVWCAFAPAGSSAQGGGVTFDLMDFGAVGDGVADDGPALQRALDAAAEAGGGTINVPAGRYSIATPVTRDFGGAGSVVIRGVESLTPVQPPTALGDQLSRPLDLVSEFYPRTGAGGVALQVSGLESFLVKDIAFVGTPDEQTDALITLNLFEIDQATVRHCEFYGLISQVQGGSIVRAARSHLKIEQTKFLGSTGNSGVFVPTVECLEWKGITVENSIFIDYGQRPELFSKTGMAAAYSWLIIGNAAQPTPDSPRREVVLREVFFDEGALNGLSALPSLYEPQSAPIDLLYITGFYQNVANLGTSGNYLTDLRGLLIEKSHYGWSLRAAAAINMLGIGNAVLDEVECVDDANRIMADASTGRLTVINSIYTHLDSLAQVTDVRNTSTPEEDPVQYVREQFMTIAHRAPDGAAHYYWSDAMLRCGDNVACLDARREALTAYLENAPTPTFVLGGQILDGEGQPVPGVSVALTGSQAVTAVTDSEGRYRFSRLPTSGVYTVAPSLSHYTFGPASRTFTTPAGNVTADFGATLNRHDIRGRVADAAGNAIPGVSVALTGSQAATATADAGGNYAFADLPEGGDYTVTPSLMSYAFAPGSQTVDDLAADRTLNFTGTLITHSIGGRVTGAGGAGVAGATLSLSGHRTATTTSDANGNYSFAALPQQGNYTVTVSRANYTFAQPSKTFNNLAANQTADFGGVLNNHTLGGRVTSAGAGLAGVVVALSGSQSAQKTTDANGNYSFTLPAEGDYTLTPSKAHYTFAAPQLVFNKLSANQSAANFAATLDRHRLSGRVADANNNGTPGVLVTLSGGQAATATTDAGGNYSFPNLPAGANYTVTPSLRHYTFSPSSKTYNDLGSDQQTSFSLTLNSHKISGRVTGANGSPLAGAALSLSGTHTLSTTSDANGNYSFTGLPAGGNYAVAVSKDKYGFAPSVRNFGDLDSDKTADFSGVLNNHTLGGRVTSAGAGLAGVVVALSGAASRTTTTDQNGNYSFAVEAAGNYTLTPSKAHYSFGPPSRTFNDLGANQTADFAATLDRHTLSGRVVNVNNGPMPGVLVTLSGAQGAATTTTDAGGGFAFPNLPAGASYTVTPSLRNHTFTPASRTYDDLGSDLRGDFSGGLSFYVIGGRVTEKGAGLAGVTMTVNVSGAQVAQGATDASGNYSFRVIAENTYTVTPSKQNYSFSPAGATFNSLSGNQTADFAAGPRAEVGLSRGSSEMWEGGEPFEVVVFRTGDTSQGLTVTYAAADGTAKQGSDLSTVIGQVTFAPGETAKSFHVFITDDSYVENAETFTIRLLDTGDAFPGNSATLSQVISDNDSTTPTANAVDDARFFVRQHYRDFLSREPDDAGLDFWTKEITSCGADAACVATKRENVSAAFFLSIEFKETGYLIYRLYKSAYGRMPRRVEEFLLDAGLVGEGVAVGAAGWEAKLEANKRAFVAEFLARPSFVERYPLALTPAQFVSRLNANTGSSLTPEEAAALASASFGGAADSSDPSARLDALRRVAENAEFSRRELNRAFVLMQYFGYLQRNPDDAPDDARLIGYNFWLKKLEDNNGNFAQAQMVKAFIDSIEYRRRFGQ